MNQKEKIMIFIDGSNLFRTFKRHRPDIKYSVSKLLEMLVDGRYLIRPYYFTAEQVPPNPSQVRFFDGLRYDGIDVTTRPLKNRSKKIKCPHEYVKECEYEYQVEKGVDVALVTKMLSFGFKNVYETVILVSGDDDFTEAVQQIKDLGKRVEICAFKGSLAPSLRKTADKFIALDDIAEKIQK